MKFFTLLLIPALLLASCKDAKKPEQKSNTTAAKQSKKKSLFLPIARYGPEGYYTGMFERSKYKEDKPSFDNQITICIDSLSNNTVFGHSIVAGNDRPFYGSFIKSGDAFRFMAREPGTETYDGRFEFVVDSRTRQMEGNWYANNDSLTVTERKFELRAVTPKYKPDTKLPKAVVGKTLYTKEEEEEYAAESITVDAIRFNASTDTLIPAVLENMYKGDLEMIRNAVYARHGYSFKNPRLRIIFDNYVSWYVPLLTDVNSELTPLEQKNIALIKRYEKHAEKYYDDFGR